MGFLFSKKKAPASSSSRSSSKPRDDSAQFSAKDRAVVELKRQRDRLRKYHTRIEKVIAREREIARDLLRSGKRERAKLALQKKKYQESLLAKSEQQLFNLEEMTNSIRAAEMEQQMLEAMRLGKDTLEKINSEISLEEAEMLMEETREAIAYQEELSNILTGSLTADDTVQIDEEYAALEALIAQEDTDDLPQVPVTHVGQADADADAVEEDQEEQVDDDEQEEEQQPVAAKKKKKAVVLSA